MSDSQPQDDTEDTSFPKRGLPVALTPEEHYAKQKAESELSNSVNQRVEQLALPDRQALTSSSSSESNNDVNDKPTVIVVGGDKVLLDKLGPLVLNNDGSLSRISNWHEMTEIEQKNTLRIIGKRNRKRRETLLKEGGGETEGMKAIAAGMEEELGSQGGSTSASGTWKPKGEL